MIVPLRTMATRSGAFASKLFLLKEMVVRDVRARYAGSTLGLAWAFAHPLLWMLLYTVVFSLVLRVPVGGYLNGGAIYHSQSGEVEFTHLPGLRIVMPSNALDACGLLRTALRADDPVMFLEHKKLYREPYNRSPHPGPDYVIPFGKARVVKTGARLTVITYGALVQKSLQAAMQVERKDPAATVEVIDLRSLAPYDWEAIRASVEKTNRGTVAHRDGLSFGYGAEIAARIADELFDRLDAPVRRVGALDTWIGYHPKLEAAILPQVETLAAAMEQVLGY